MIKHLKPRSKVEIIKKTIIFTFIQLLLSFMLFIWILLTPLMFLIIRTSNTIGVGAYIINKMDNCIT